MQSVMKEILDLPVISDEEESAVEWIREIVAGKKETGSASKDDVVAATLVAVIVREVKAMPQDKHVPEHMDCNGLMNDAIEDSTVEKLQLLCTCVETLAASFKQAEGA
jgi:hypothetical protein